MSKPPREVKPAAKKPCVACRTPIEREASICPTCKSYQANWRNLLQYFSGQAAIIGLAVSACVWVATEGKARLLPTDDVGVVSSSTLNSTVFVNRGDREVFLSHFMMWNAGRTTDWLAPRLNINEKISPGAFLKKDWDPPRFPVGSVLRNLSPADFEAAITKAVNGDPCYQLVFFEESDPELRNLRAMSRTDHLNLFPVEGYLEYWTPGSSTPRQLKVRGWGDVLVCPTLAATAQGNGQGTPLKSDGTQQEQK